MKKSAFILSVAMAIGLSTLGYAQTSGMCVMQQALCNRSCGVNNPACIARCLGAAQRCINQSASDTDAESSKPSAPDFSNLFPTRPYSPPTQSVTPEFETKTLRNWGTFDSAKGMVRVGVRDHECEDGDRLRVSVNGEIFETELTNQWEIREFMLRQGQNRIDILAVNGSGYKGRCSYHNANTGEIAVTTYRNSGSITVPDKAVTQSWQLRAGAGSTSSIFINVK